MDKIHISRIPENIASKLYRQVDKDGYVNLYASDPSLIRSIDHTGDYQYDEFIYEVQGSYLKVSTKKISPKTASSGSSRGAVTDFSAKSRKRLMEKMARVDWSSAIRDRPVIFVTLTYGQKFPSDNEAKKHLRAFLERIRRFAPNVSGVWRVELQKRGAPHFHFLFFNLPYLDKSELALWWGQIIGSDYLDQNNYPPHIIDQKNLVMFPCGGFAPFTRIEAISSRKRAMYYVSKYVAKHDDDQDGAGVLPDDFTHYVQYSDRGEPDADPIFEDSATERATLARAIPQSGVAGGFIYVPYLHARLLNFDTTIQKTVWRYGKLVTITESLDLPCSPVGGSVPVLECSGAVDNINLPPFFRSNSLLALVGGSSDMLLDGSGLFQDGWLGRHWGVFNRGALPLGELKRVRTWMEYTDVYRAFHDKCQDDLYLKSRLNGTKVYELPDWYAYQGFSIFLESPSDADKWIKILNECLEEHATIHGIDRTKTFRTSPYARVQFENC